MSKKPTWINEEKAAEMLGYEQRTLRRYVKSGKLSISFTHINGRNYKYCEQDIEKMLFENATIIYS